MRSIQCRVLLLGFIAVEGDKLVIKSFDSITDDLSVHDASFYEEQHHTHNSDSDSDSDSDSKGYFKYKDAYGRVVHWSEDGEGSNLLVKNLSDENVFYTTFRNDYYSEYHFL